MGEPIVSGRHGPVKRNQHGVRERTEVPLGCPSANPEVLLDVLASELTNPRKLSQYPLLPLAQGFARGLAGCRMPYRSGKRGGVGQFRRLAGGNFHGIVYLHDDLRHQVVAPAVVVDHVVLPAHQALPVAHDLV